MLLLLYSFLFIVCKADLETWLDSKLTLTNFTNLGDFSQRCLGNLQLCENGISLSFYYEITKNEKVNYLLSTGGETQLSNGFYLRKVKTMYELKVAEIDTEWSCKFFLKQSGIVHLAFDWSANFGLRLFVDGFFENCSMVEKRIYSGSHFDFFTNFYVGRSTIWRRGTNKELLNLIVYNVTYQDKLLSNNEIQIDESKLLRGCVTTTLNDLWTKVDSVRQCRSICKSRRKDQALFANLECRCSDANQLQLVGCDQSTPFKVYWSSHYATYIAYEIKLNFLFTKANKDFQNVHVNELLTFRAFTDLPIDWHVNYVYRFGDGNGDELESADGYASKKYRNEGIYTVTVTAFCDFFNESKQLNLTVQKIDHGKGPELVEIYNGGWTIVERTVRLYATVIGDYLPLNCSLNYGDGNDKELIFGNLLNEIDQSYTYDEIGIYRVNLTCRNAYSSLSDHTIVYVPKLDELLVKNKILTKNFIDFRNPSNEKIRVEINKQLVPVTMMNSTKIEIPSFQEAGEYLLEIYSFTNISLFTKLFKVFRPLSEIHIESDVDAVLLGREIAFVFNVTDGDSVYLNVKYGDGTGHMLYLPNLEKEAIIVRTSHTYKTYGRYNIELEASNEISLKTTKHVVTVERPIEKGLLKCHNITRLGNVNKFSLIVDEKIELPLPIDLHFDYGDGIKETVHFHNRNNSTDWLLHEYIYKKYGIFRVNVKIANNISSIDTYCLLQVGRNITQVDLLTETPRSSGKVLVEVKVPIGSPINIDLDMGDGNVLFKRLSNIYQPDSITKNISEINNTATINENSIENTNNKPIIFQYDYKRPGKFQVRVRAWNEFGEKLTWLCPDLIIIDNSLKDFQCDSTFSTLNQSSELKPIEVTRSSEIFLHLNTKLNCLQAAVSRYSWKAFRKIDGIWKPELNLCFMTPIDNVTLPKNIFWYGDIKLVVSMMVYKIRQEEKKVKRSIDDIDDENNNNNNNNNNTVFLTSTSYPKPVTEKIAENNYDVTGKNIDNVNRNQYGFYGIAYNEVNEPTLVSKQVQVHLRIKASPLIAEIKYGKKREVMKDALAVTVDSDASHDPDVVAGNRTGIKMHLICSPELDRIRVNKLTDFQLLEGAVKLVNNTLSNFALYENGNCFKSDHSTSPKLWVQGFRSTFSALTLTPNRTYNFKLIIEKDNRNATFVQQIKVLLVNTSGNVKDLLAGLLTSNDTSGALFAIDNIIGNMDSFVSTDNKTNVKNARTELKGLIINVLGACADRLDNYDQLASTSKSIDSVTGEREETTEESRQNAANAIGSSGEKIDKLSNSVPLDKLTEMATNLIGGVGNVVPRSDDADSNLDMEFNINDDDDDFESGSGAIDYSYNEMTTAAMPPPIFTTDEPEVVKKIPTCCENATGLCDWIEMEDSPLLEDLFDIKDTIWTEIDCQQVHPDDMILIKERYKAVKARDDSILKNKQSVTAYAAMKGSDSVLSVLVNKQDDTNNGIDINTPNMKAKAILCKAGEKPNLGTFDIPDTPTNGGAKMTVMANPYIFDQSAKRIQSAVQSLTLTDENGKEIKVANSTKPYKLWNKGKPESVAKPVRKTVFNENMTYYPINLTSTGMSIHALIYPTVFGERFQVFIKYGGDEQLIPTRKDYDYVDVIPRQGTFNETGLSKREIRQLIYTFMPPANVTDRNGSYIIGVTIYGAFVEMNNADNSKRNYTYDFQIFLSACLFWNVLENAWSSEGCQVGPLTTKYRTQCLCNHLTSFGGDMVVPPNTIDFKNVWAGFKNLSENAAVFSTVIIVLGLYVIVLIVCRYFDKKDLLKWGATQLDDNLPTDKYHYQLTVYTGVKKNAGTKSKVSFILSGDNADSGVRRLDDGKRKEFETGSVLNFILSVENCLGPLTFLRIWHDNSGKGKRKGWFLDQIVLLDLQTGDKFFFLCDKWLAVESDDGQVDRILPVASFNDLTAFKHLFSSSLRKKLTNDHLWVSVFSRPTRSNFSRVQRISCCVSLLFMTMITSCMFYKAEDENQSTTGITLGPFTFTLQQLFVSVVSTAIVFPPSLILVTIFRKIRPKNNLVLQNNQLVSSKAGKWRKINPGSILWPNKKISRLQRIRDTFNNFMAAKTKAKYETGKKKRPFMLPHWMIYVAYIICFLSVVAPAFFTILYSMQWGKEKSNDWLLSFVLSFFQSVIVVQPIKVLLLAAFISCIMRKPDSDDDDGFQDQNATPAPDEVLLTSDQQRDIQELITRRRLAASEIKPPDFESLEKARKLRMNEIQMEAILKECLVYFSFILVLFFISYQTKDMNTYILNENIKNTLIKTKPSFNSITKPDQYWTWLRKAFIPNFYSSDWYNGDRVDWRQALTIDDRSTIRVGIARLRQQRIKDNECKYYPDFRQLFKKACKAPYSWTADDTKNYDSDWSNELKNNSTTVVNSKRSKTSPWIYRNSVELMNAPYVGERATYKGGGYVLNFYRTKSQTLNALKKLEAAQWLDTNTRPVFLEFTLYNGNKNLFASVIMLAEFQAGGSATIRTESKVFRIDNYVGSWGIVVLLFEVIFLAFTIYFIVKFCKDVYRQRIQYFKEFWNLMEFSTLVASIVSVAMYGMKRVFASRAMSTLKKSQSNDYVNFVSISIWDETFTFVVGVVVFLGTLKLLKMLKFNKRMGMLGDTIRLATKDLKTFSVVFFIFYFAFCQFAYLLFNKDLMDYSSFVASGEALFAFVLGSFDFHAMQGVDALLGPLFFILYVFIVYIGLMSVFLTIIYESFAQVKANAELRSNDYEIVEFILKKFKGIFGCG